MWTIYEQASGKGNGLGINSFLERFDEICAQHIKEKRAKAFALILYDFTNRDFKRILKDQGVFTQLDRLAGKNLSIFFLHAGKRETIDRLNQFILSKLDLVGTSDSPCVIFFRFNNGRFEDIVVSDLDSANLIHGFHELHNVIESYIKNEIEDESYLRKGLKIIGRGTTFVGLETFRALLKKGLDGAF